MGVDALNPLEERLETWISGDINLADAKKRVGHKMCLVGSVPTGDLETGSKKLIERRTREAIEKAEKYKTGSVGITCLHVGALYWYSRLAVEKNMIGICLCRGGYSRSVAPYGGVEGRLGTNPLCVAIPAGEMRPIMLDIATTGVAGGHLAVMGSVRVRRLVI